nr:MAG TPA: hypothetical protein [Crassvirales sp.]
MLVLILLILFALICTPVEELHRDTSVLALLTSTIVSNRVGFIPLRGASLKLH